MQKTVIQDIPSYGQVMKKLKALPKKEENHLKEILESLENDAEYKEMCAEKFDGKPEDNYYKLDAEALKATIEALTNGGTIPPSYMEQLKAIYHDDMDYFNGDGDEIFQHSALMVEKAIKILGGNL